MGTAITDSRHGFKQLTGVLGQRVGGGLWSDVVLSVSITVVPGMSSW